MATLVDDDIETEDPSKRAYDDIHIWRQNRQKNKGGAANWAANQAGKRVKQAAKQVAKQGLKRGTQAALAGTGFAAPAAVALEIATNRRLRQIIIWSSIGVFVLIIVLFQFFFKESGSKTGSAPTPPPTTPGDTTPGTRSEIPSLVLRLDGPSEVANGGQIEYTVTITYDSSAAIPIDSITLYNNVPINTEFVSATGVYDYDSTNKIIKWPLSETANRSSVRFTLRPVQPDVLIRNRVYATSTFSVPAPGGGGGTPMCSQGLGWCSPERLLPYFGAALAGPASIVCNAESGGNPGALNTNCNTNDYSVGLFQINLVAHCPGAYGSGRWGVQSCDNLLSASKRSECQTRFSDPIENIKYAVQNQKSKGWSDWGAARACGVR